MNSSAMTSWQFPLPAFDGSNNSAWTAEYWVIMLLMWWVMMIAMMIPSASPVILLYARVQRHANRQQGTSLVHTASFLLGYLLAWLMFSVMATLLQWILEQAGLVHQMMMWSTNDALSVFFLLAAGAYQLSPIKQVCLEHCRSPAQFLSGRWRQGKSGALQLGLQHGLYCVGCCWFLMLLLFVGGAMNLVWIAGLAILVLLEKLLPGGRLFSWMTGLSMFALACWQLAN